MIHVTHNIIKMYYLKVAQFLEKVSKKTRSLQKTKRFPLLFCLILASVAGAQPSKNPQHHQKQEAARFRTELNGISQLMYRTGVGAPHAGRFYAYALLGAYEIVSQNNRDYPSLKGQLIGYQGVEQSTGDKTDYPLSATLATLKIACELMYITADLEIAQKRLKSDALKNGLSQQMVDNSDKYAQNVCNAVMVYANRDGFRDMRKQMKLYSVKLGADKWQRTPPEFFPAVEWEWQTLRPFVLDSARQCKPAPPTEFSMIEGSPFRKMTEEVVEINKNLTAEQKEIALFWENTSYTFHKVGTKAPKNQLRQTPGTHWIKITSHITDSLKTDFDKTVWAHTLVALTLHDGFISTWAEKYRSERVRPITVIRANMDKDWEPFLNTPAFPEYSSGHSVLSTAVAAILSQIFGDNIAFTDDSEKYAGMKARQFTSFRAAAEEASISRLYGGIHFRDAVENGKEQGKQLAKIIMNKLGNVMHTDKKF
jgi:PAP2 superfamily